jgi:hypothetical protein
MLRSSPIISGHPDRHLRDHPLLRLANISPLDCFLLILISPLQSAHSPNSKTSHFILFLVSSLRPESASCNFLTQFRSPDPPIALFSIQPIHQSIKKFDHGRSTSNCLSSIMLCHHPRPSPNIDFFTASRSERQSQSSARCVDAPNVDPVKAVHCLVDY